MIQVINVSKSYGAKHVLADVSFEAPDGAITGFVGPNGAGKSTTMRIVACVERPDGGQALVDGAPFTQAACPGRTMGAYLGVDYLPLRMTGEAYVTRVCSVSGVPAERAAQLLDEVELGSAARREIGSYSLGMKQRAGLAAALAGDPGTLMLDEPVNGLDPMGVQWLRRVLRAQADAGKAVLLSSHLLSELELVADRVVMLDAGKVVSTGDLRNLEEGGGMRVLVRSSDDEALAGLLAAAGADARITAQGVEASGLPAREVGRIAYSNGLLVDHLEEVRSTLEEVFMAAAGKEEVPVR